MLNNGCWSGGKRRVIKGESGLIHHFRAITHPRYSYHSESSILTTLFTLLIWPVLFHPLPGAFETSYQTAPLDLGEDTFAPSRRELLEGRLAEMSKTKRALELLREVDNRERPRGTWAVGVNWEYEKEDLEEILECLGGKTLSGVCRMLAEEYRHRASGVPDLM